MFCILYIPSDKVSLKVNEYGIEVYGKWQVDTDDTTGTVAQYDDLEEGLDRIKHIRRLGGEAALAVIIE